MVRLLLTILLFFGASAGLRSSAADAATSNARKLEATGSAKAKVSKRRATPPTGAAALPNLNAPSMDFTGVTPETGDTANPRHGPESNIRPTMNGNGQPGMGMGF